MATQPTVKKTEQENIVPFRPLSMFEEMERMLGNMVPQRWMRPFRMEHALMAETLPQIDIIDRDDSIVVRAALPGVDKKDLEVSTTHQTLTLRGSTQKETREEKGEYFRHEISRGNFLRTVTLPAVIDESKIKAKFKDGLLEVTLPKLDSAKRHTINIESD
jgi:HSP20 family protein